MLPADDPLLPGTTTAPPAAMLEHWGARLGTHTGPLELWQHLGLGARGQGLLTVPDPEWLAPVLDTWLGGPSETRVPLAYTGLGDIIYFRDLSQRARDLGLDAEAVRSACDVSILCTRYKRIEVLTHSMPEFIALLGEPAFVQDVLDRSLFAAGVEHAGAPGANQILGFVPALALGGSEEASSLQALSAPEHWEILFQL